MGNSIGKDKGEETVDGGQLMPHGVYKGPQDWDYRSVRKLIVERKLAPFYKGLSDYDENCNEVTSTTHNSPKNGEVKNAASFIGDCNSQGSREAKRALNTVGTTKGKEVPPSKSVEAQLYKGAIECPICFLYYPRNINHSRCCDQPICTECFVQIKRPEGGTLGANNSPAVCPFCVEPNFGVCYKSPSFSVGICNESSSSTTPLNTHHLMPPSSSTTSLNPQDGKIRRKSVSHKNPDVVTTDQIRPDWATRVLQQPPRQLNTRRSTNTSSSVPRRVMVRSGGGGSTYVPTPASRRTQPGGEYGGYLAAMRMGTDLEELMVMEAIRLSLLEQDERERREREERDQTERTQDDNSNNTSSSDGSTTGTITSPNLSNNENSEGRLLSRIDNTYDELLTPGQELLENDDDYDGSSVSHSHDQTPTTVSTPITASTEDGTIRSTSNPSSRGSGPSTPSSTTNSTNEVTSIPSSPSEHNHNIISTEISVSTRGPNDQEISDSYEISYNDETLPLSEIDDHGQVSEQVNDIKRPSVSILSNSALGDEALVRNESDDDTRDPR